MHWVFLGECRFGNQYSLFLFKVLRGDLRETFPLRAIVMAIVIAVDATSTCFWVLLVL